MQPNDYAAILASVGGLILAIGSLAVFQGRKEKTGNMPAEILNNEVAKLAVSLNANTEALQRNTAAASNVHDIADDLKQEVRDLRIEIRHGKS